jgi:hypothetical protein
MYYSYIEIDLVATSFSPARTDLAVKLLSNFAMPTEKSMRTNSTSCVLYLNTWRYLQVIDPRVTWRRHNHNLTARKE